jgi:hypothetical protein
MNATNIIIYVHNFSLGFYFFREKQGVTLPLETFALKGYHDYLCKAGHMTHSKPL